MQEANTFQELFLAADERRRDLRNRLEAEETDCWRLFHGVAEGRPGLTIDRYGPLVLAQTFRDALEPAELAQLEEYFGPKLVYNHRGKKEERFSYHEVPEANLEPVVATEGGLKFLIKARHRGLDPHLFLDLRSGRRWVKKNADGKSVVNFFSYSCGLGLNAVAGGAGEVWNVDFSASALAVGSDNLALNGFKKDDCRFVQEDYFPVAWQLSGLGVKGKRARKRFLKMKERQFDLVLLDPPAFAKGTFQAVDLVKDYQSLFKPALLMTAPGGTILATNNVGRVGLEEFGDLLLRCAKKAGRPLQSLDWLEPEEDFPSFDGEKPLKIALCKVGS